MHTTLSTSVVSLHSHINYHLDEKQPTNKSNKKPSIVYFFALFYGFLSMGLGAGLPGPTLLKFAEQTHSSLELVIYIPFIRSFGFLLGTIIAGFLIDRFPSLGHAFLAFITFIMSVTTILIPFMYHLAPMIIVHFLWSIGAGGIDNLAQILAIRHYENMNVNPYLQALHGAFGVGAFFAPFIIAPFLRKSSPTDQWHYAYWIIGCLQIPNIIWVLFYAIRDKFQLEKTPEIHLENKEIVHENKATEVIIITDNSSKTSESFLSNNIIILGFTTILILMYVGDETAFGVFIHTYATLQLGFTQNIAAYLNSVYWASFAISRLCGVLLSIKLSPTQILTADLTGCIVSLILLLIFNKSALILWIGTILFGFSIGSIYPSAIGFVEKQIPVTGRRMSVLAVGGSTGDALIPLLVGYTMNSKFLGPVGLVFISLVVIIVASILFGCTHLYVKCQSNKDKNGDE